MKTIATVAALLALALPPLAAPAQNTPPPAPEQPHHFYRLHFSVEELNAAGKIANTRSYDETITTQSGGQGFGDQQIKTGSRIPIATGSYTNPANTQFQYIDLGVDLDVRNAREQGDMLEFRLRAEISSMARQTEVAGVSEPVIRQNTWDSTVAIPIGKPTVVGSSDDLDNTGRMQVEVTATRVE